MDRQEAPQAARKKLSDLAPDLLRLSAEHAQAPDAATRRARIVRALMVLHDDLDPTEAYGLLDVWDGSSLG